MIEARGAVRRVLEDDPILLGLLGLDQFGKVKVYEQQAVKDSVAPYLVWAMLPGAEPQGTYKDNESIESLSFQVSSWGRSLDEAWQVHGFVREALRIAEWDVYLTPYSRLLLKPLGDQTELFDEETSTFQVPATWRLALSR